jgi:hypothetical protein
LNASGGWATTGTGRDTNEPNGCVVLVPILEYFIFDTSAEDKVQFAHIRHTSRRRLA